jgi:formylglycine-generating enzyme required for sulfatase activity
LNDLVQQADKTANGNVRISAAAYQPYVKPTATSRFRTWHGIVALVLFAAVLALFFLFTARSVALDFSASPGEVDVDGGFSIALSGVWLLRPGDYTIKATAPGYEPLLTTITVGPQRNQRHQLKFVPLPGVIDFVTEPAGASVKVDGTVLGETPLRGVSIAAGSREIVFSHPRYQTQAIEFTVSGHEEHETIDAKLLPNWGNVTVSSTPAGAEIHVDGEPTGIVTPNTVEIIAGEREVSVVLKGYRTARQRIIAAAQQDDTLANFKLVQADAVLRVTTSPAGAGITLNGEYAGESPLVLELRSGQRLNVEAFLRGHKRASTSVTLQQDTTTPVAFSLVRETGQVVIAAEPRGATLTINGISRGEANQTLALTTEPQRIEITLAGHAGYSTTVTPRAGLVQTVKVKLLTTAAARLESMKPEYTSKAGPTMVLFEPGKVQLGASRREPGRRANENLRDVTLDRLFYLGKYEITNAQFRQFASGHDSGEFESNSLNKDTQPVVNVGWQDAALYCNWLSSQEGLPAFYREEFGKVTGMNGDSTGYRLPSEAEWAFVARHVADGKPQLRFPWGDNMPPPDRQGNYADRAASHIVGRVIFQYNDNHVVTAPVGSYKPNAKGIHDLGGNVAEWIHDFYASGDGSSITSTLGPTSGEFHVISGSSWMHGTITDLRLAFRDYGVDGRRDVGFRVARFAE